ncbi:MAG: glycoside hydrolase family 5 protein [Clostridia bacterium]|nr:glycoside hydrolase family 5 protein [Clostridia bacterium]
MKRIVSLVLAVVLSVCIFASAEDKGGKIVIPNVSYIKQYEIPENEAMEFMKKMGVGWNLGNTFDAYDDNWGSRDELMMEKTWVGVLTKPEMITDIHAAGFNTLRLPVSWHNHVDKETFEISEKWLDRVQEVLDYAINDGMYVILNTHHDVYPGFYYPTNEHYETSAKYIKNIWTQLSERFKDYDEHLIFESMNEPRLKGHANEWSFSASNADCMEAADCINRLNQLFVDTVRASGGNNADRYLMVPGYDAAPENALGDYFVLPKDTADNKIIVSVHAYTPYAFALQDGGTDTFELTNAAQTSEIIRFVSSLYKKFVVNGIPVVIGEYGARAKNDNLQSRVNYAAFYACVASSRNIPCVWWDNNGFKGSGELFGIYDRRAREFRYPEIAEAMTRYGGYDKITPKN